MAAIHVNNLTFCYDDSFDNIFEHVTFTLDTNWKLGFIGRNGKGKTTFLKLLLGEYSYKGSISSSVSFDYFPYPVNETDYSRCAYELMDLWKPNTEDWCVFRELPALGIDPELLYRPISTLSFGELTKVMLAILFSGDHDFLLIDEPTNHLDRNARDIVKQYLSAKKGFILVSHDRDLLDACIDHVLVLNRSSIEVQSGNFSSWWENKEKADHFARAENEKHLKEIRHLKAAADKATRWAEKNENTKIGFDPLREPDRMISTRAYIGAKTKKMQARAKSYETRIYREIAEKEGLLKDIEAPVSLRLTPLSYYKDTLVDARDFSLWYSDAKHPVINRITFQIRQGDILFLHGDNGCGKSSLIKAILQIHQQSLFHTSGTLEIPGHPVISYISQDTSCLNGTLQDYALSHQLDYSLFLTLLRQLDFDRTQFQKQIQDFSEGQKKKVLIAASLLTPAHLYIWDEPLNYIDVFSRIQLENLISHYHPTMLIVEHDIRFREKLATKVLNLS